MRLIDADVLIEKCGDWYVEEGTESGFIGTLKNLLVTQPTITPEPHWIPCSAGLPKTNDPVNVTWVNHNPEVYYMGIKDKPFTATAHYHRGHWYWYSSVTQDYLDEYGKWTPDLVDKDVEILAWMPLPEPYKG